MKQKLSCCERFLRKRKQMRYQNKIDFLGHHYKEHKRASLLQINKNRRKDMAARPIWKGFNKEITAGLLTVLFNEVWISEDLEPIIPVVAGEHFKSRLCWEPSNHNKLHVWMSPFKIITKLLEITLLQIFNHKFTPIRLGMLGERRHFL